MPAVSQYFGSRAQAGGPGVEEPGSLELEGLLGLAALCDYYRALQASN